MFEFRLGEIEHLPMADESVDVIISNCVINLSPEKKGVPRSSQSAKESRKDVGIGHDGFKSAGRDSTRHFGMGFMHRWSSRT